MLYCVVLLCVVCVYPVFSFLCTRCCFGAPLPAQATGTLYEQGGLNHDMLFTLTAVGFYSLDGPEAKKVGQGKTGVTGGGSPAFRCPRG